MITISTEQKINAPAQKVWDVLWEENSYKEWTKHFAPGSCMQSDWKINGKTYFTDESRKNGMVSTIVTLEEAKEVVFQHLGILKDSVEDIDSEDARLFSGALEKYYLREEDGVTILNGSVETPAQYEETLSNGFEQGFAEVKRMAEAHI